MQTITEIENRRKILTANHNLTNMLSHDEFIDLSIDTLDIIEKYLMNSYGKYSSNTLIIYEQTQNVNVFTTDGIHKLEAIEFISPIQQYITELICYIGNCVEKKAKDGTTTSMLFSSILLKDIFKAIKYYKENLYIDEISMKIFLYNFSNILISKLTNIYDHTKKLNLNLKNLPQTDKDDIIKNLIKVTSKHYYEDIEKVIFPIIRNANSDFYEYFGYKKTEIETNELLSLEDNDYDYTTNVQILYGKEYFNKHSNTSFEEKADVIIIPQVLDNIDLSYKKIWDHLDNLNKSNIENKYIVFLCKFCDYSIISNIVKKYNNLKFIFVQYMHFITDIYESCIELFGLIHGSKFKNSNIFPEINIKIEFNNIYLYNIFDYSKSHSYENLLYYNKSNKLFNKWVKDTQNLINYIKNKYTKSDINTLIKEYTHIFKKIVMPKYPNLIIGGRSLDHLELIDIIEDTIGNISVAYKYGVILNYYRSIIFWIKNHDEYTIVDDIPFDDLCEMTLPNNIELFIDYIIVNIFKKFDENRNPIDKEDCILNTKTVYEMYNRAIDILPKIVKCTNVVVPRTININQKDKK